MKTYYVTVYLRENNGHPLAEVYQIEAKCPKDAAYLIGRQFGFQCKQTFQGLHLGYIDETGSYDKSYPICLCIISKPYGNQKQKWYGISQ